MEKAGTKNYKTQRKQESKLNSYSESGVKGCNGIILVHKKEANDDPCIIYFRINES